MSREEIAKDPIIDTYINMARHSQAKNEMPVFSETLLRFSFKEVFGNFRGIDRRELSMYRKLLFYYYIHEYPNVRNLLQIMICFTEQNVDELLNECESVIEEWRIFLKTHLMADAYRRTFTRLITEWSRRYKILYGKMNFQELRNKSEEFSVLLKWRIDLKEKCLRRLQRHLMEPLNETASTSNTYTERDLDTLKLIQDLLPKLSSVFRDKLRRLTMRSDDDDDDDGNGDDGDDEYNPQNKRLRLEKVEVLNAPEIQSNDKCKRSNINNDKEKSMKLEDEEYIDNISIEEDSELSIENICSGNNSPSSESSGKIYVELIEDDQNTSNLDVIDFPTALQYLSDVHNYALLYGHNEASELLLKVTKLLQKN